MMETNGLTKTDAVKAQAISLGARDDAFSMKSCVSAWASPKMKSRQKVVLLTVPTVGVATMELVAVARVDDDDDEPSMLFGLFILGVCFVGRISNVCSYCIVLSFQRFLISSLFLLSLFMLKVIWVLVG